MENLMDYKHNYPEQYRDIRYKLLTEPKLIDFINDMDEILYRKIANYYTTGEAFLQAMKHRFEPMLITVILPDGKKHELSGFMIDINIEGSNL